MARTKKHTPAQKPRTLKVATRATVWISPRIEQTFRAGRSYQIADDLTGWDQMSVKEHQAAIRRLGAGKCFAAVAEAVLASGAGEIV